MYMLGLHYEDGTLFLKKDIKAAWGWYVNAAEKGHAMAIQRIVKAYRQGELGQTVSPKQADYWNGRLSINN
ncbi:MAG: SEL1-like repeat protein [Blastochloris viridis]|uniref:SEL1-like repeat protein n=1 Tax=Blastochloris viridis TaxID=1079 RepID=A0A6N4RBI6_BLAVI|nr:MAG: SEL1-like repeat protein [Blastochloris viridis]